MLQFYDLPLGSFLLSSRQYIFLQHDREELESPIKVAQHREHVVEPVTALASDDLDKHAYPDAEPEETEASVAERVKSAASVPEGSPVKVVKRRESIVEPVTALASDDLDKHAYPEAVPDETDEGTEQRIKSAEAVHEEQTSGRRTSNSSHQLEKPMSSKPRDEPLDSPDDDVVIGVLGPEVQHLKYSHSHPPMIITQFVHI
jgi:hypothetical protein